MPGKAMFWVIVSGVIAIAAFVALIVVASKFRASADWREVQGRVISSEVRSIARTPGTGAESTDRRPVEFEADIVYEYHFEGQRHEGRRIYPAMSSVFSDSQLAQELVDRFPAGEEVSVYVDPDRPSQAALIKGDTVPIMGFVVVGVVILLVLGIFGVVGLVVSGVIDPSKLFSGGPPPADN